MYKWASYLIVFCTVVFVYGFGPAHAPEAKKWVIVIDPGHGGKDPGCHGKKFQEKNIALAVSLKLGHYLEDNDKNVKVVYTRTTDAFVPLNDRADIANKNHADIFICIHLNASPDHSANGSATYVMAPRKSEGNLEVEKQENSAIFYEKDYKKTYEGFDPNSPEGNIIFSMYQNLYLTQSLDLSTHIQDEYEHHVKRKNNGVKQAGFLVLWKTAMPSLLTEIGFLTNPDEEKYMGTQKGEDEIAKSIFLAFEQYKAEKDKTNYDPKDYSFKSFYVQNPDSARSDTTETPPIKTDTLHGIKKTTSVKDTTDIKDVTKVVKPLKKDSTSMHTADTLKHVQVTPPQPKDSADDKAKRMKDAMKALKPDTVAIVKKTDSIPPPKKIDSIPKPKVDTVVKKTVIVPKKVVDSVPKPKVDTAVKKIVIPHKKVDTTIVPKPVPKKTVTEVDTGKVVFKVQFTLSDHELAKDDKHFQGIPDVDMYLDNKIYKYTAGNFSELKDAVDLQSKLRDKGYKDAFVVAFKGRKRITIKQASGK